VASLPRLVREIAPRAPAVRDTGIATGASVNVCVCLFPTGTSSDFGTTFKPVEWSALFHQQQRYETHYFRRCWRLHLFLGQSTFLLPVRVCYTQLTNVCKVVLRVVCPHP
jgi:hypothetical protein